MLKPNGNVPTMGVTSFNVAKDIEEDIKQEMKAIKTTSKSRKRARAEEFNADILNKHLLTQEREGSYGPPLPDDETTLDFDHLRLLVKKRKLSIQDGNQTLEKLLLQQ
jgi:hypothetical protein